MTPQEFGRKLTTILNADVKGYSRLMGEDEESTLRTLNTYKDAMGNLIHQHRGRVVRSPEDSVLAEFASVADAVQGAVEIPQVLRAKNSVLPENRRTEFRIEINLGDVIEEGDSIYGDGVNIAARLEGLANAGGNLPIRECLPADREQTAFEVPISVRASSQEYNQTCVGLPGADRVGGAL
jgi:adenylate cyclase